MISTTTIHEHAGEWIAAALTGGLNAEEMRSVEEHVSTCEACRQLFAENKAMTHVLENAFLSVQPSPGFEQRAVAAFRRKAGQRKSLMALLAGLMRRRSVQVAGGAGGLAALILLGSLLTSGNRSTNSMPGRTLEAHEWRDQPILDQSNAPAATSAPDNVAKVPLARADRPANSYGATAALPKDRRVGQQQEQGDASASGDLAFAPAPPLPTAAPPAPGAAPVPIPATAAPAAAGRFAGELNGVNTYAGGTNVNNGRIAARGATPGGGGQAGEEAGADGLGTDQNFGVDKTVAHGPASSLKEAIPAPRFAADGERLRDAAPSDLMTPASAPPAAATDEAAASVAAAAPSPPPATTPEATRRLIRNAQLEIEVASFDTAVDGISGAAARDGGYVDTKSSSRQPNGKLSGSIVVKVLPENLDRFLIEMRSLGELKNQTLTTEDVTKDYFDTEARLRNDQRMEERLLKMLDEAKGKLSEVLQVEKELARVRESIEKMRGDLKLYDFLVRYATVTINLSEKDLNQPAAFLLKETATLALLSTDVEKTYADAKRVAADAGAQVVQSNINRADGGVSAVLNLLITPDAAEGLITKMKALGRVEKYTLQDERVAQDGSGDSVAAPASAKVKRDQVVLNMTISQDEQVQRVISMAVVTKELDLAFDKAKAAAINADARILNSTLSRPRQGAASASLILRVPAKASAALIDALKALGRPSEFNVQRNDSPGATEADEVQITLSLVDQEPAVQQSSLKVLTTNVEMQLAAVKQAAAAGNVELRDSSFERQSDGQETANLTLRMPLSQYAAFIEHLKTLGQVKDLTVQRHDRPDAGGSSTTAPDDSAPAEIALQLYSQGSLVADDTGIFATLRETVGEGAGALLWSVRMIGVAVAFMAPWFVALGLLAWVVYLLARRRSVAKAAAEKNS